MVIKYFPVIEAEFRKAKRLVVTRWRMDEAYIKIKGEWMYYYRAVDKAVQTIDFFLSPKRDTQAAKSFFKKAIKSSGRPEKVNIDKSGANLSGLEKTNKAFSKAQQLTIRQVKYLKNIIEQEHRGIKRITRLMLGFKGFNSAAATLSGIELYHMIRKGQNSINKPMPFWKQFYSISA